MTVCKTEKSLQKLRLQTKERINLHSIDFCCKSHQQKDENLLLISKTETSKPLSQMLVALVTGSETIINQLLVLQFFYEPQGHSLAHPKYVSVDGFVPVDYLSTS